MSSLLIEWPLAFTLICNCLAKPSTSLRSFLIDGRMKIIYKLFGKCQNGNFRQAGSRQILLECLRGILPFCIINLGPFRSLSNVSFSLWIFKPKVADHICILRLKYGGIEVTKYSNLQQLCGFIMLFFMYTACDLQIHLVQYQGSTIRRCSDRIWPRINVMIQPISLATSSTVQKELHRYF